MKAERRKISRNFHLPLSAAACLEMLPAILAAALCAPANISAQELPVRVALEGLAGPERRNAMATLSIATLGQNAAVAEPRLRRLHARAPREIALALQPFGYYRPEINSDLTRGERRWIASYDVKPGPRVMIDSASIVLTGAGAEEPAFSEAVGGFPAVRGTPLSHADYELGKTNLLNAASAIGYLDATFLKHELRVNLDSYTADVDLVFDTGPRYRFGETWFTQDVVNPEILQSYLSYGRGDPFSVAPLLELQSALIDSPYFSRVEVVPRRDSVQGEEVPIEVNLTARRPQRYEVGVGYGTNTGPRANAQAEFRRLNRRGHRALSELSVSLVEKRVAGRYVIPFGTPGRRVLSVAAGFARLTPSTSTSDAAVVSATLATARGRWQETVGLTFQLEDFEVGTQSGTSFLTMPTLGWWRTSANDRVFPTRGARVRFELLGALEGVGSNASFVRAEISSKVIRALSGGTRLLARAELGGNLTSRLADLPPSIRFFAGGDQSVRGYAYRSLGPTDAHGDVVGGRVLAVGGLEVDQRIVRNILLAAFFDFGNALDTVDWDLNTGVGAGVRWLSPVGPVRLDVAFALSLPGNPLRIHVTVGPDL